VAWIGLLALCLGLAGCRLFGKKSPTAPGPADAAGAPAANLARPEATAGAPTVPAGVDGLLAGRVLNSYGSQPPVTAIRVVALDGGKEAEGGAPIDVWADAQGYFTIFKLKAGQHYKLVARAKDGDRLIAGVTYVTPPDPKVVIRISEDFAGANIPPLPGQPTWPGAGTPGNKEGANPDPKKPAASLERPSAAQPGTGPAVPGTSGGASVNQQVPATPTRPEDFVDNHDLRAQGGSPPVDIRGPAGPSAAVTAPDQRAGGFPAARSPSCQVVNNTVNSLVLNDLDGRPWEFPTRPHGRLVLLDFWGTWCPHCVHAIPELVNLQARYGSWGLDVIGIAYEQDGTPEEQARRVRSYRDRFNINYHLLLGSGMTSCPVKTRLGVQNFPTLILLDEQGHILWRGEGLSDTNRVQLESRIPWYLNVNAR
jgi:thiol-disulfide isomerase/thioredoxin